MEAAVEIVTRACKMARALQRRWCAGRADGGNAAAVAKEDASPVTVADFAVQSLVLGELHALFPDDVFIAEENSANLPRTALEAEVRRWVQQYERQPVSTDVRAAIDLGGDAGGHGGRVWVLDPVDGTKGFLRNQQFCIALALLERGQAQLGVLGCPNLPFQHEAQRIDSPYATSFAGEKCLTVVNGDDGCVFYAARGGGAFMRPVEGAAGMPPPAPRQVHVNQNTDPSWATLSESVERAHSSQDITGRVASILGVRQRLGVDSQCKYGMMARGEVCIFLRFPRIGYVENIWDHAAGYVVLREAGGTVSDAYGADLDFGRGRKLWNARGIVATNGRLHPAVLAAVQHVLAEEGKEQQQQQQQQQQQMGKAP